MILGTPDPDPLSVGLQRSLLEADIPAGLSPASIKTVDTIMEAAQRVLVARGYHGTAVRTITAETGLSHGIFYHYFRGKDHVTQVLALRALRRVASALVEIPSIDPTTGSVDPAALRRWLRRYGRSYGLEAAMIRVWIDATENEPQLRWESAAVLEWSRQRMARVLEPRGFGDVDADALLLIVTLDAVGARAQTPKEIEAAALVIERGLVAASR